MMLRTGIFRHARRHHWAPVAASLTIRYQSPLKRFQRFTLASRLAAWDDRWFFIEHTIERKGTLKAFAVAKCCFRGPDGVVPPATAFAALGIDEEPGPLPGYTTRWAESEELLREAIDAGRPRP